MAIQVWNSKTNTAVEALQLPAGRLVANFSGLKVEVSDNTPDNVLAAAEAVVNAGLDVTVATGAKLMVVAQQNNLAFENWGILSV